MTILVAKVLSRVTIFGVALSKSLKTYPRESNCTSGDDRDN
jgi:hypothetical protein